jgi:hypothetical protein
VTAKKHAPPTTGSAVVVEPAPARLPRAEPLARRSVSPALPVWAVWLAAILAVVAFMTATGLIEPASRHAGGRLWPLWWWDATWYVGLGQTWYPPFPNPVYAFFPLWPLLLRASGPVAEWVVAGGLALVGSLLCFTGVAAAGGDLVDRRRTALVLACFPGSVWLALVYPDALAVGAAAWACALAQRGRPFLAAAAGAACAAARPAGLLVTIPLAAIAARRGGRAWLTAAAPLAAAAAVEAYFWYRSGAADAFFQAQHNWHRDGPQPGVLWDQLSGFTRRHPGNAATAVGLAVVLGVLAWRLPRRRNLLLLVGYAALAGLFAESTVVEQLQVERLLAALVLPLLLLLWMKGPRYRIWAAYATAVVGLSFVSGSLQSFGRQALFAFPIFWAVADGPPWLRGRAAAAVGIAANVVLLWMLGRFAP